MRIKRFFEMQETEWNWNKVISILKSHGWGEGALQWKEEFENNSEYFHNPQDDSDWAQQFHIFLTDYFSGQLRGELNRRIGLRVGDWQRGVHVRKPISFYSKST
jgi:hypothetical protein